MVSGEHRRPEETHPQWEEADSESGGCSCDCRASCVAGQSACDVVQSASCVAARGACGHVGASCWRAAVWECWHVEVCWRAGKHCCVGAGRWSAAMKSWSEGEGGWNWSEVEGGLSWSAVGEGWSVGK